MVVASVTGALTGGSSLISHRMDTKYLPVGVTLTVALFYNTIGRPM